MFLHSHEPMNDEATLLQNYNNVSGNYLFQVCAFNREPISWPNGRKHAGAPSPQPYSAAAAQNFRSKIKLETCTG
jgi:hypothetical protein